MVYLTELQISITFRRISFQNGRLVKLHSLQFDDNSDENLSADDYF